MFSFRRLTIAGNAAGFQFLNSSFFFSSGSSEDSEYGDIKGIQGKDGRGKIKLR